MRGCVAFTLRTSSAPADDGQRDLHRIEAVDRDAHAPVAQRGHGVADPAPGRTRVAAQVDHVGPLRAKSLGLLEDFVRPSWGAWLISARISMS